MDNQSLLITSFIYENVLHPTSSLLDSNLSTNYVIYHELVLTKKEYMNCVTTVDPIWLLEYGYKFLGLLIPIVIKSIQKQF